MCLPRLSTDLSKTGLTNEQKLKICQLVVSKKKHSVASIARKYKISDKSVYRWVSQYRNGTRDFMHKGRPPTFNPSDEMKLLSNVKTSSLSTEDFIKVFDEVALERQKKRKGGDNNFVTPSKRTRLRYEAKLGIKKGKAEVSTHVRPYRSSVTTPK
jgi:transposase-like protein